MRWHAIKQAMSDRNHVELAIAMQTRIYREPPERAMQAALWECSVGEVKRLHAWAEEWLSDRAHDNLRARGDHQWRAMNSLYQNAKKIIVDLAAA